VSAQPELVDIGINLTHASFDRDRDEVVRRAADAGVSRLIVTGTSWDSCLAARVLADANPGRIWATAGIHPHHAADFNAEHDALFRSLARQDNFVAVGECGLDFYRDYSPRVAQRETFEAQLRIAADTGLPVFLHQRDAHEEFTAMLSGHLPDIPGGVAHCFTGGEKEMHAYLELGLHIGITGWICDERRGAELRRAIASLPLDRILLETDAPYLLPRDLPKKPRGRRNEPAFLPHILDAAARYMNRSVAEVGAAATRNASRLFGLAA